MMDVLLIFCLGIGKIYKDSSFVNEHLDDEWPEGTPAYLKDSLLWNFKMLADMLDGNCQDLVEDVKEIIAAFDKKKAGGEGSTAKVREKVSSDDNAIVVGNSKKRKNAPVETPPGAGDEPPRKKGR